MIQIEVVFAKPDSQTLKTLMLMPGATVQEAILKSGIVTPREQEDALGYGVWNKPVEPHHVLQEGDRVEVYRPLTVDPKTKRQLIIKKKAWRKAGLRK